MQTLSIAIQKGGSGKTTTAINLAAALSRLGQRVLLVDLDPQANLTQALGYEEPEPNMYHLLKEEFDGEAADIAAAVIEAKGFDFLPASLELATAELELIGIYGREKILSVMLGGLDEDAYDICIIDCPPAIGMLTVNALAASDHVLLPMQAEFLPLKGVHGFMRAFKKIKRQLNPNLEILGIVLTRFNARAKMNKKILEQLSREFEDKVFSTHIRTNNALAKAQEWGVDIFTYDSSSNGAYDYMQLAREVLERIKRKVTQP